MLILPEQLNSSIAVAIMDQRDASPPLHMRIQALLMQSTIITELHFETNFEVSFLKSCPRRIPIENEVRLGLKWRPCGGGADVLAWGGWVGAGEGCFSVGLVFSESKRRTPPTCSRPAQEEKSESPWDKPSELLLRGTPQPKIGQPKQ